jgi:hypothetical protein
MPRRFFEEALPFLGQERAALPAGLIALRDNFHARDLRGGGGQLGSVLARPPSNGFAVVSLGTSTSAASAPETELRSEVVCAGFREVLLCGVKERLERFIVQIGKTGKARATGSNNGARSERRRTMGRREESGRILGALESLFSELECIASFAPSKTFRRIGSIHIVIVSVRSSSEITRILNSNHYFAHSLALIRVRNSLISVKLQTMSWVLFVYSATFELSFTDNNCK